MAPQGVSIGGGSGVAGIDVGSSVGGGIVGASVGTDEGSTVGDGSASLGEGATVGNSALVAGGVALGIGHVGVRVLNHQVAVTKGSSGVADGTSAGSSDGRSSHRRSIGVGDDGDNVVTAVGAGVSVAPGGVSIGEPAGALSASIKKPDA